MEKTSNGLERSEGVFHVIVVRLDRFIDRMFSVTVVALLAILFINFGAAIDIQIIKEIFRKPIGPAIGAVCQLVIMPLVAYGLGRAIFPNQHEMALGLFLGGIVPAGGASNIWALLLGGNLNLSIAMTTISTLVCFGTIPLWLFLLGRLIFERANLGVPYLQVTLLASSLLIPLAIGILIKKCSPRIGKILVRIMKPLSLIFLLIMIAFGIATNLYLVQMFAWQVSNYCTLQFSIL